MYNNMNTTVYDIHAFDIRIYCKITITQTSHIISFGSGNKQFCLNAIYELHNPTNIYIDRIEHNAKCVVNGSLDDFSEGTIKIVKTALWFMKQQFTQVKTFSLQNDSQIYCQKSSNCLSNLETEPSVRVSKLYKLSLSFDYIIKHNQTWYQSKFKAKLPELLMDQFNKSLQVLDSQIMEYEIMKDRLYVIEKYEKEYKSSATPREFIQLLRKKYRNTYCFEVGSWLNSYMKSLHISLYAEQWYIDIRDITKPESYIVHELNNTNSSKIFYGGKRKTLRRVNFRLGADRTVSGECIGYYQDFQ